MEQYNRLTQMMRPYRELRGFYFGVRSTLHKMCSDTEQSDTFYTQLKEIKTQKKGDGLYIDYNPLRKKNFSRVMYIANMNCPLLYPLQQPHDKGEEDLGGYFSKKAYELILPVIEDVICVMNSGKIDFKDIEIQFEKGSKAILKRIWNEDKGKIILCYRFNYCETDGTEIPSEEIRFFIDSPPM